MASLKPSGPKEKKRRDTASPAVALADPASDELAAGARFGRVQKLGAGACAREFIPVLSL
jgi:hypothetical protein